MRPACAARGAQLRSEGPSGPEGATIADDPAKDAGNATAFPRGLVDVPGTAYLMGAFGATLMNADGIILDVNEEFSRLLGYRRDELIGKNLLEIVHPDDHALIARTHSAMRRGRMESDQTRRLYLRKDGAVVYATAGVVALRDPDGVLVGILKQVQDITRRVRAERDLQQSLAQQRVVLDALAEGVIVYDGDGRARVSNPSARDILGVSAGALHGARDAAAVRMTDEAGEPVSYDATPMREALRTNRPVRGHVFKVLRDDGTVRWVRVNAQPLVRAGAEDTLVVASLADVTPLKLRERELVHRSLHDPLTDLPNRRFFLEYLARRALRRDEPAGAVLVIDLAQHARVNELYGHAMGDRLLKAAAQRIAGTLGPNDFAARLGTDEFCIYLPEARAVDTAVAAAQAVADVMAEGYTIDGIPMAGGVTVGVALLRSGDDDAEEVLDRADASLRRAKREVGRGPVAFSPEADESVRRSIRLARDLVRARERGELTLRYDPIVRLGDGATVGERSRMRWNHPRAGEVDEDATREIARRSGLAPELSRWALGACLRRARSVPRGEGRLLLTVSVSPDMLLGDGVRRFRELFAETAVDPASLILAVDAEDDAEDPRLADAARAVGQLGVGLMLEHSGRGRTRARAAAEFPYQWLGVHRSAIHRGLREEAGRVVTRGVLHSLRDAGVRTLAETPADGPFQTEELRSLGFDYRCGAAEAFPARD